MWWNTQWIPLIEERYWKRPTCGLVRCQVGEMFRVSGDVARFLPGGMRAGRKSSSTSCAKWPAPICHWWQSASAWPSETDSLLWKKGTNEVIVLRVLPSNLSASETSVTILFLWLVVLGHSPEKRSLYIPIDKRNLPSWKREEKRPLESGNGKGGNIQPAPSPSSCEEKSEWPDRLGEISHQWLRNLILPPSLSWWTLRSFDTYSRSKCRHSPSVESNPSRSSGYKWPPLFLSPEDKLIASQSRAMPALKHVFIYRYICILKKITL